MSKAHWLWVIGLAAAGCAAGQVSQQQLVASRDAVRAAQKIGADAVPAAALHVRLANEQIEAAEDLMRRGEASRANYVLRRAAADADLALALAQEAPLRAEAQRALDDLQALQDHDHD